MRTRSLAAVLFTFFVLLASHSAYPQQGSGSPTNLRSQPVGTSNTAGTSFPAEATKARVAANYRSLPLSFEINKGQTDDHVKFVSRRPGFSLFLTPTGSVLSFSTPLAAQTPETLPGVRPTVPREILTEALYITLAGANPAPTVEGLNQLITRSNYFIGNDPKKWQTSVPNYAKVKYVSVYPGVDLVYYGNERALEHDFIVAPGGDPRAITLEFGQKDMLRIDKHGDLVVKGKIGEVHFQVPVVYQEVGGNRQQVAGRYMRKGKNRIGFRVGRYDVTKTLVIDPVLSYSTYDSAYSYNDIATAIAVDSSGSAYVIGRTGSANFPVTPGAFETKLPAGSTDAFVMKLNASGSAVIYATYLGGSGSGSIGDSIAVDSSGNAYVTGDALSSDFPTTAGAFQTNFTNGPVDPFVAKLDPTGSTLIYSTFLGGLGGQAGNHGTAIAVDSAGSAYVTGSIDNGNFPTTPGAFQTKFPPGLLACFVMKLNDTGSALAYSTFLGGGYEMACNAIAVDSAGSAYVTGDYLAANGTPPPITPGAFQTNFVTGTDAFVTKLDPTGTGLLYSTFLSGGNDKGTGIAVDSAGSAYVTGWATSSTFPTTPGAFQTTFSGTPGSPTTGDAFVAKLTPDGSGLIYSTYLGGSVGYAAISEAGVGGSSPQIAVDSVGSACIIGTTSSKSFPITPDAFQSTYSAQYSNAFVTKLSGDGSGLAYSTYLGGSGQDLGLGIAVDPNGSIYVAGLAGDVNFPTTAGAFQPTSDMYGGGFVAKFAFDQPGVVLAPTSLTFTSTMVGQSSAVQTVTFSASGSGVLAFKNIALIGTDAGDYGIPSTTCSSTLAANASCQVGVAFTPTGAGTRSATLQFTDDVSGSPQSVALSGTGVNHTSTTTALTSSLNPALFGQSVTFTATVSPITPNSVTPTGSVTFYDGSSGLGTSLLNGNTATLTTSTLAVGTHSITSIYSGDTNFLSSTSGAVAETITVATPPAFTSSNAATFPVGTSTTFTVTASGSPLPGITLTSGTLPSGLTFAPGNGTATISGTPASGTSGTYLLTFTATNSAAAISQAFTLTVDVTQTISFAPIPDHFVGDAPFVVNATASSGLAVTFAASGNCTISGNTVTVTGAGSCTITASRPGNTTYGAAAPVSQTFNITTPGPCPTDITSSAFVSATVPFFGGEGAGVVTDPAGNVYVAENPFPFQTAAGSTFPGASPAILMVSADGSMQTLLAPAGGFGDVTAVAFYQGNLYVADGIGYQNPIYAQATPQNAIWQYNPSTNVWTQIITGINDPTGIAFANGNIYVSSWGSQKVYAYSFAGLNLGTVWAAPDPSAAPYGIAFDANGNLFIAGFGVYNNNGSKIFEVAAADVAGYTQTYSVFVDPGIKEPASLAFDANENLFVTYYDANKILRIAPNGTYGAFPGGGISAAAPNGIAIDYHNNVFSVINAGNGGQLIKIQGLVGCSRVRPVINWPTPSPIAYGTTLSATQLDATAVDASNNQIQGTFMYSPATGAVLSAGNQTLSVTFTPNDTITYSTATASVTLVVNAAGTTTVLTVNPTSQIVGMPVNLSAAVASTTTGTPSGTVTFYDGTTSLGTVALNATGPALTISTLSTGTHSLTATYNGDANFLSSTSAPPVTETISALAPPVLTTISSAIGLPGTTVAVTLIGTALTGTTSINVSGTGMTASIAGTATDTTVTANFTIAANAELGVRNVTVTTPDGTSNALTFTIATSLVPAITLTPTNLSFGFQRVGTSATQKIVVGNTGGSPLTFSSIQVQGKQTTAGYIGTVAGNGTAGYSGDGGPATSAGILDPPSVAVDRAGNLFIADRLTNRIRRVDAVTGIITTVAGSGTGGYSGDGGPATSAELDSPNSVAVDRAGNIFIADSGNNCVRQVDVSGNITTVAGTGTAGFGGDGSAATGAQLNNPTAVAVDAAGNVYIADANNQRIRLVKAGIITTVAGTGIQGYNGVNIAATNADLSYPSSVAVDSAGNLFIANTNPLPRIFRVDAVTGIITTVAGNGDTDVYGDGGPATSAGISSPLSVAVDSAGNLFIATVSNLIRRVNAAGIITTVVGTGTPLYGYGTAGYNGDNIPATSAELSYPSSVAVDTAGNLFISDQANDRIRRVDVSNSDTSQEFKETDNCSGGAAPCTIAVTFTPALPNSRVATLVLTDNDPTSPQQIPLNGVGTQPSILLSTTSLTFPNTTYGQSSPAQTVILANSGNGMLTLTSAPALAGANPGDFSLTNSCGSTLAPNANCQVQVTFTPTTVGARSAILQFTDDAPGSPHSAALNGASVNPLVLSPAYLTFGQVMVGVPSAPQTLTLSNTGGTAISAIAVIISGDFFRPTGAAGGTCGATLAPGASCTINVVFKPQLPLAETGTMSIGSSVPGVLAEALEGQGILDSTTTSVNAPSVPYGASGSATVSVASPAGIVQGNATLIVDVGAPVALPLTNGAAVFNLGVLSTGAHTLSASFAGQGTFGSSTGAGTFTVTKAEPIITWAPPTAITYGTPLSGTQLNATASVPGTVVPGTYTYTPPAGTVLSAGSQTLSVVFTPDDPTDYATASLNVELAVTKASQTITLTGVPSSATFGQAPFTLTASATSSLPVFLAATGNCSLSVTSTVTSLSLTGAGSCTVTATQSGNSNYNYAPTLAPAFTIGQAPTTTLVSVSPGTVQYSDYASFSATVTPISAAGQTLTGNVQFYLNNSAVGSAVPINSSGVATLSQAQVNLSAGSYPVRAVFSATNTNFARSSGSTPLTVTQENAFILYSGDTIAQVGTTLNLRATVWDSAAAGYLGINPETGPTATIGDITKMWIAFDIYPAGSCGSGTPSTLYVQVALTSTAGVGTATTTLSSTSEVSYCVVSRLVAGSAGGTNLFYVAPYAQAAGVDFYVNSGQVATGGGWVIDPTGSHGNFSFNARYKSTGSPKGQKVYTYRGSYNGVVADFIIKSNAITGLQFSGTTYPVSATLQGKCSIQINRASDGYVLFSAGNYTFSATVTDSGQTGATGKQFSLIVYDPSGVPYHSVPPGTPLQGGNVVVRLK